MRRCLAFQSAATDSMRRARPTQPTADGPCPPQPMRPEAPNAPAASMAAATPMDRPPSTAALQGLSMATPPPMATSRTAKPNAARPPKLPTTGSARPVRKKPGPKKKMSRTPSPAPATPSPMPTAPTPTLASMEATHYIVEEDETDACNMFDGMPASVRSFSNMMDESVAIDGISLAQPFPMNEDTMEINPTTKKRGQRAANYSAEEDHALIMAWESVSLDAIVGVDQSLSTYWSRIEENFHCNLKTPSNRTLGSLQHRWSVIQDYCNKWASCKKEIERLHPSGVPLQEQVNYIQARYKQLDQQRHRPFTMLHCWALLEHNEKWRNKDMECPPKKPRSNNSSASEFGTHEDGDEEDEGRRRSPTPSSGGSLRPPGRRQEKERQKKEAHGGNYKEAIQEMIETKKKLAIEKDARWMDIKAIEERKVAIEEEKLRIKNEKHLVKKKEQDERIMFMDISVLDDTQKAYVEARRAQILAEMLGGSGSGSGRGSGSM